MSPAVVLLILKVIDLVAAGLQLVGEDKVRYATLTAKLRSIIEEGREPSEEEFAELDAESADLTARILAARDGAA